MNVNWMIRCYINKKPIGVLMVRLLALSVVDHGFEPQLDKTKGYIKLVFLLLH